MWRLRIQPTAALLAWLLSAGGCNTYSDDCMTQRERCLARCQKSGGYVTELPQGPDTTTTGCERECGNCTPAKPRPAPVAPPTPTSGATTGGEMAGARPGAG